MANGQRVLVVDGISETEQVLKAVLEPRGMQVQRVRSRQSSSSSPDSRTLPHVIVLHEDEPLSPPAASENWREVPRVIIGSASLPEQPAGSVSEPVGEEKRKHYLQNPFHYGELIQAIEQLLQNPS